MSRDCRAPTGPRIESRWLWAVPVVLAIEAFAWIVAVGFQDDDFLHFYNLATLGPFRFVLLPHGNHPHALRNLVLVGMRGLFGLHSEAFMACVLLTHLLNVVLCYLIGVRLTRDPYVATVAAALWAVAYTSSGTLGWYYVAQFPIALLLAVATARLGSKLDLAWRRGAAAACIVALAIVVALRGRPSQPASAYTRSRLADLRAAIETIAHAVPSGETAYVRNRRLPQAGWLVGMDSPEFPGLAAFFCILFPDNVVDGRQMRFVEPNPAVRAAADGRPRVTALLVAAAPPGAVLR